MNKAIFLILFILFIPSVLALTFSDGSHVKLTYNKISNSGYYNSTLGVIAYGWGDWHPTFYELNQNDTNMNYSIEQRAPIASPTFTGLILGARMFMNEINATNMTLNGVVLNNYNDSAVVNQLQLDILAHNSSIEARTSYNDSAVVNALQGENTSIYNILYELNANDTALNLSIEQRAPLSGAAFTGAITGTSGTFTELNSTGNITTNKLRIEDIKFYNSTFLGIWSNSTTMIIGNITGYA